MKNINMKKVVAGAAALGMTAMLAGAVVAANVNGDTFTSVSQLTKAQLFNNGVPSVNIAVGSAAQPVDVIWAGNIAAAIGQKAYTTSDASSAAVFNGVTVKVGSSSTNIVTGDGKLLDDTNFTATVDETLDSDDYSLLEDYDVDVDDDGLFTSDTVNVRDYLHIGGSAQFNSDSDVGALTYEVGRGDLNYEVTFNEALPDGLDDSDTSPDMKFKFFGKEYTVKSYDKGSPSKLELVQNENTTPYALNSEFSPEDGYVIAVTDLLESSDGGNTVYSVELTLKDTEGNVIAAEIYDDGDDVFNEYLTADVEVDKVYTSKVNIISGSSSKITLKDGDVIEDFPNNDDELWKVNFEYSDANTDNLAGLYVYNYDSDVRYEGDDALLVNDSISLPNNFAKLEFLGLTTEDSKLFTIEDGIINFQDSDDKKHNLFIYDYDDGTYNDGDTFTTAEDIDGKKLYFTFYTADETGETGDTGASGNFANFVNNDDAVNDNGYFTVQLDDEDGDYLSYDSGATPKWSWSTVTTPTASEKIAYASGIQNDIEIPYYKNTDKTAKYSMYIHEVDGTSADETKIDYFMLGLTSGTQATIDTAQSWGVGNIYVDPENGGGATSDKFAGYTDTDPTDGYTNAKLESVAEIVLSDTTTDISALNVIANVDVYTGNLVDTGDADIANMVDGDYTSLDTEDSDDLQFAYTNLGTYYSIDEDDYDFYAKIPEKQLNAKVFVGGGISTDTTINGSTFTLTADGQVDSNSETGLSAQLISHDVTGGSTGTTITPAAWNINDNQLVWLDSQAPSTPLIVVGGYMVNSLAQNIGMEDLVTTAGEYVSGSAANGNIYVAGFTADDTAAAAKELITAIENMQ